MKALVLGLLVLCATSISFADPVIDCPPDERGGTYVVITSDDGQTPMIQDQETGEVFAVDCKFY